MTSHALRARVSVAAICCTLAACALTSKSDPMRPRYFSPESGGAENAPGPAFGAASGVAPELRLGRITASSNLREQIIYRSSESELGYYEDRRWTERPETYLRRALAHALFEQRGLTRAVSGMAPTLEVELVAFEEIRPSEHNRSGHKARLQAIAILHDQRIGRLERTITVERPIAGKDDEIEPVVRALSEALQVAVDEISSRVAEQVAALVPAPTPPTQPAALGEQ